MQIIGTKYQIFEDGVHKVRRAVRCKNTDTYILKEDGSNNNFIVTSETLNDQYIRLIPDAFLNIMITREEDFDNSEINDIYFCVNRSCDLAASNDVPSLILRQNIYSRFKNIAANAFADIYVGECATVVNSSKEELIEMMTFKEIKKEYSISVYLDDSLEDILACIPNKLKKDINALLIDIKRKMPPNVKGTTESIEELFEDNDFIGNYKSIFNITQIDFPIVLGDESYNSDDDIILNSKQKSRIEDMLRRYIDNVKVIKYDKDIDISKIVAIQHIVVCDSDNKIYLIAYDVVGYYTTSEDDKQVFESMGIM